MRRGEVIGEIMRRSVLGERRDIPQTGDGLTVWNYAWQLVLVGGACKKNGNTGKKVRPPKWYFGVSH